ncbi:MAG: beta-ketoacyl-[acyl-carrier-protein] synthase family protein [Elusimicrobiota bacterium]
MNKVVITGIGLVTPLGTGRERTWGNLLGGLSAVSRDAIFDDILTARVNGLDVPDETRLLSMGFLAAAEALHDSLPGGAQYSPEKIGCTVSVSKPNLAFLKPAGLTGITDLFNTDALGSQLQRVFKFKGPLQNITAACATGTDSIILGAEWIRRGECDVVFAGAAESPFSPLYISGFTQMGVLAENAVRPFDRNREGFAIGEGAAVLVLENKQSAILRGARIYGELSGWAMSNDASHEVAFGSGGDSIAEAVNKALKQAGNEDVDYINAHGTATRLNDLIESRAIKKVFGAKSEKISISSTKAATGHMLGATGAAEAAFCLLAMRDNVAPATLNLFDPDPECGLDFTPVAPRRRIIQNAMSLSFGFGGQIGVVIFLNG